MLFELDRVSASRGGARVLEGLSARIGTGATALVGPSGSGKSTLLRLLNRLADPDAGEIRYRGEPLAQLDPLALRRRVALVPQLPAPLPGSVADNLRRAAAFDPSCPEPEIETLLEHAGLAASYAGREASRLSVGEQQRAMLARALATEPDVLLLDEPTSALDPAATEVVERALSGLGAEAGVSLVLVTHDPGQAERLAEQAIELAPAGGGS